MAIIIRVIPPPQYSTSRISSDPSGLADFFQLDWVNAKGARAEILFLHREKGEGPETSHAMKEAHVAFPGGRMEEGDEGGLYTGKIHVNFKYSLLISFKAMRQTWEEIGLDLAERDFICVGQLDDREITTSLGKRLLMILSPFGLSACLHCIIIQLSPWYQCFSR